MSYCIEDFIDPEQEIAERGAQMTFAEWKKDNPDGTAYDFANEMMRMDRASEDASKAAGRF